MKHILFLFTFISSLSLIACKDKQATPDWNSSRQQQPPTEQQIPSGGNDPTPQTNIPLPQANSEAPLRFVAYNLRNYLTMRRGKTEKFKPEHEIKALIDNIERAHPDILGVCEIGTQSDLDHFIKRLKKVGLDYPHSYLSAGPDPYRRQALLSKYPIRRHNVPKYTYQMLDETHEVRRGILDASVSTPKGEIRFLGVHLKSKRPIAIYDQAEIRREEAQILRTHATEVLSDATRKVVVFGDMNDTKGSSVIKLLQGPKKNRLNVIDLYDKYGTKWTQYWAREDIYSRFDFIFVSTTLLPEIDQKQSHVLDTPPGDPASDHRALVLIIK